MGRYGDIHYPTVVKRGVVLGLLLLAVGEVGGYAAGAYTAVPTWEEPLFFAVAALGLAAFALSPILFGIVLPLTE